MEKKKLQRIIGILTVIVLAMVLLFLFFNKPVVLPIAPNEEVAAPHPDQQTSSVTAAPATALDTQLQTITANADTTATTAPARCRRGPAAPGPPRCARGCCPAPAWRLS